MSRNTIIGRKVFTAEIASQHSENTRIDWRKCYADLSYAVHSLPVDIELKLLALMDFFSLEYGAVDMIVTPENEYIFLELNPTNQFGWIEDATGMPLFLTLAHLLAQGKK